MCVQTCAIGKYVFKRFGKASYKNMNIGYIELSELSERNPKNFIILYKKKMNRLIKIKLKKFIFLNNI